MKNLFYTLLMLLFGSSVFAQAGKQLPPSNLQPGQEANLEIQSWFKPKGPISDNPFGVANLEYQPIAVSPGVVVTMGDEGLPIYFEGTTSVSGIATDERTAETLALAYVGSLQPAGIKSPSQEFALKNVQFDKRKGEYHVKLQQQYMGVPVFGAELIAHTKNGVFAYANGRYARTPQLQNVQPEITPAAAIETVIEHIGRDRVKTNWTPEQLEMIGGQQFTSTLVIYQAKKLDNEPRLVWQVQAYPNMLHRMHYFVDAKTGEVLNHFNASCSAKRHTAGHEHCAATNAEAQPAVENSVEENFELMPPPPPIVANGIDLKGVNRTFGAWLHTDNQRYLMDTSKPMFNAAASDMPGTRQGVIVTLDQKNVFDGPLYYITSPGNTFASPKAVSAHANAGLCYDYYKNTFDRNGIDGKGGTINVIINVPDENGPMDNAYWNGNAIYWGNGNTYFGHPLQRALDIGGHEMTHGVVQETAGLVYENESGALNESMADVFGVMIDRDNWLYSEDAVAPGQTVTGADRNFADPHNGTTQGNNGWQPRHYSERYIGPDDNGGVHANSGITNYAYYLFATHPGMTKEIAEQVYYYTLRDRLTSSSKFIDLRLAAIAEATEYWNQDVVNAVKFAFDSVGVKTGNPTTAAPQLQPGTGKEYILGVTEDGQDLNLFQADGTFIETIYTGGVLDKPSVTDNGEAIVFVNNAHQIMGVEIAYNGNSAIQYNVGVVSQGNNWRNAAISKDGRFLAALTTQNDNKIIIFDLADPLGPTPREYFIVNPTYTVATPWVDNVEYADILEFDYTGQFLIYDALSHIVNADGEDLSHWDIGMLKYWENGQFTPTDMPQIRKIVTGLPDHAGVANPAFSKNKPHVITFDYYVDLDSGGTEYQIHVADFDTGKDGPVVTNEKELAYPSFTTHDDKILFQDVSLFGGQHLRIQGLKPNLIEPMGNPANIVLGHKWGTWLNNSTRVLTASSTNDPVRAALPIAVSPNPVKDAVRISLNMAKQSAAELQVVNAFGQVVAQQKLSLTPGENQLDFDAQTLLPGTYFIKIAASEAQGVAKIVKH